MKPKVIILATIVLLPTLTLIPLGSFWLWQNGYVLLWVGCAFAFTTVTYWLTSTTLLSPHRAFDGRRTSAPDRQNEKMTPVETAAWEAVERFAAEIRPSEIRSRDDLLDLAARTIATVAREFHPDEKRPVWKFTVPEFLALTEQVSARLRPIFIETIPLAEHLSVGQMLKFYELRSVAGVAENVYDLWRLVRVVNPLAAIGQEARERVTKQVISGLRDDLAHRIARLIIFEIARASIDLYSGKLRVDEAPENTPVRIPNDKIETNNTMVPPKKKSRLGTAWSELGKVTRATRALYGRRPKAK